MHGHYGLFWQGFLEFREVRKCQSACLDQHMVLFKNFTGFILENVEDVVRFMLFSIF